MLPFLFYLKLKIRESLAWTLVLFCALFILPRVESLYLGLPTNFHPYIFPEILKKLSKYHKKRNHFV